MIKCLKIQILFWRPNPNFLGVNKMIFVQDYFWSMDVLLSDSFYTLEKFPISFRIKFKLLMLPKRPIHNLSNHPFHLSDHISSHSLLHPPSASYRYTDCRTLKTLETPVPWPLHLLFILSRATVPRYLPSMFPHIIQVSAKCPLTKEPFPDSSM